MLHYFTRVTIIYGMLYKYGSFRSMVSGLWTALKEKVLACKKKTLLK